MMFRLAQLAFATCALASLSGAAHADETHLTFSLAGGKISPPITVPGINTPTTGTCSRSNIGDEGMGSATLRRTSVTGTLLWVGINIAENMGATPKVDAGQSVTTGTLIIYCDFGGLVAMQVVNGSAIQIQNKDSSTANVAVL